MIEDFKPNRVAVDSLSALERIADSRAFREFVISLTSFLKRHEMTGLFTSTTPSLLGGRSVTEKHISTLTDSIILLRYIEAYGQMRRGITVLKMRGSHAREGHPRVRDRPRTGCTSGSRSQTSAAFSPGSWLLAPRPTGPARGKPQQ